MSYELCVCEISSAEAWENSGHVYGDGCKTMHLYARRRGGGSMTGPGLLTRSPARKTHVSLGRTGSLPSSTGLGVYSPDLQILSSSSASPLPAWCSQSCSVSVQKMQDRIIIAFQKEVLCICKFFFFFPSPFRISKIWLCLRRDWNTLKEKTCDKMRHACTAAREHLGRWITNTLAKPFGKIQSRRLIQICCFNIGRMNFVRAKIRTENLYLLLAGILFCGDKGSEWGCFISPTSEMLRQPHLFPAPIRALCIWGHTGRVTEWKLSGQRCWHFRSKRNLGPQAASAKVTVMERGGTAAAVVLLPNFFFFLLTQYH